MLKSKIVVDLPSAETDRRKGPIEWVRSLFGAKIDLRSGKEELTVGAFSLVEGLIAGFGKAGVDDALSFLVDKRVVYLDTNDVPNDLPLIVKAAETTGILDKPFKTMHLVLSHRSEKLHTILDCTIANQVILGEAEMKIELSSRLVEMQVKKGESAEAYAERVKSFASTEDSFEPFRKLLDELTVRVAHAMGSSLVGSKVTREDAVVQLIRPDARQIKKFGQLGFGDNVQEPGYRSVPTTQRGGAYADPFYYYYHDPYYDFMSYMLVSSMIHNAMWHSHHVHVVDSHGSHLYSGDTAASHANDNWVGGNEDAVKFDDSGNVSVSDAVTAEAGSDYSSGWGTPNETSYDSTSSCATSSSCASSSSCGSSCSSSSSCGSSCGGSD